MAFTNTEVQFHRGCFRLVEFRFYIYSSVPSDYHSGGSRYETRAAGAFPLRFFYFPTTNQEKEAAPACAGCDMKIRPDDGKFSMSVVIIIINVSKVLAVGSVVAVAIAVVCCC